MDEELEAAKERGWREVAAINAAYAAGEIGEEKWHEAMAVLVVPNSPGGGYLDGPTGSGAAMPPPGSRRTDSTRFAPSTTA